MKKSTLLYLLFSLICLHSTGQVIPHGMNYQAVARDKSGRIIQNKTITLKINMQNQAALNPVIYYSEIHRINTNELGLFSIVIGKGLVLAGNFNSIPWSTENIWLELFVKSESDNLYTPVYSTEMLAVPYAFHAGTASEISGNYIPYYTPGGNVVNGPNPVPATSWQVTGNVRTNPPSDYLGTSDNKDLYFKTNAIERMRILSTGNISISTNLSVGVDLNVGRDATVNRNLFGKDDLVIDSDLTVKKNVQLNSNSGSTVNYGPFKVDQISPTVLTGTLRVDQLTNLNDSLTVNNVKPTLFTGTLGVSKSTNLYSAFNVNVQAPSVMTGTLRVDSNVTLNNRLRLDNPIHNSFDSVSGEIVVLGGVGIGRNINIGGDARISGNTEFNGQVKITDGRPAINPDSGALVVTGGVGIGKQLTVGGYTHLYDSTTIEGSTKIDDVLSVSDSVTLKNKLRVMNTSTFNGALEANGQVTVTAPQYVNGNQSALLEYPLNLDGGSQGISIKVNGTKSSANNFVTFMDQSGTQGRIEGVAAGEYLLTSDYADQKKNHDDAVLSADLAVANATFAEASEIANLVAAIASSTACVGLGVCATTPIPSLIAVASVKVGLATVFLGVAIYNRDQAYSDRSDFVSASTTKNGVTYESGAGDYAEYLELLDKKEKIFAGDIVGLKSGKITRKTEGADKIMVISTRPIVLGNLPKEGTEGNYRVVAFLGQVPVKVTGLVQLGDYILPDGNNAGIGKAIHPENLKSEDIKNIVGVAWSASEPGKVISTINVAIGLNVIDNQNEIDALLIELNDLNNQLTASDKELEKLVPGYSSTSMADASGTYVPVTTKNTEYIVVPQADQIQYYPPTRQELEIAMVKAIAQLDKTITDPKGKEFIAKAKTDRAFRNELIRKLSAKIDKRILEQKELNKNNSK